MCLQHHDIERSDCQQTLRCLYYHEQTELQAASGLWRAGAHTDFDTLTLLFQQPGESGTGAGMTPFFLLKHKSL